MAALSHIIDVHTHVVPSGLPFGHDERFPALVKRDTTGDVYVRGKLFRTVGRSAWSMPARLEDMNEHGIAMQGLSVMPELFCYWAESELSRTFCRALNESIATMVAVAPGRFVGLGTVPLQDLDSAIRMLTEVRALGLAGVQVGSNVNGISTGSVEFLPFFQAAAELDLCVFVHAFHPPHWSCVADPPMSAAVNFPPEIGTCIAAMLANGFIEQSPGLRLGASHGAGTLLLHLARMAAFWSADGARLARSASPYESAQRMWFDSLTYDPAVLRSLIDLVGAERILVGSDYPFFAPKPGYVIDDLDRLSPLSTTDLHLMRHTSAMNFLGLGPTVLATNTSS